MPDVIVSTRAPEEFLVSEGNDHISREKIVLAAGPALGAGRVLGRITATGKYVAVAPAASDGSQTAVAILARAQGASASDRFVGAFVRLCEVNAAELDYGTLTAPQIVAAKAQLATATVIVREAA